MDIRYSVEDVVKFFLSKEPMTPKKLQKILYFAYSWYLAIMNDNSNSLEVKLFSNSFQAWIHGPVCPEVYSRYRHNGANEIESYTGSLLQFSSDDLEILEEVWEVYGKYTANELESISHQHDPWKITRKENNCSSFDWCNAKIEDELIFNYYTEQLVNNN